MKQLNWKRLSTGWLGSLLITVSAALLVPASAMAQANALPDFADLVERVSPSVVNIRTLEKVTPRQGQSGQIDPDMLEFFRRFGLPVPNVPRQTPPSNHPQLPDAEQPRGVASGFVLSADGYIMTNAHVVDGADEVVVTLTDKREFKAKIIGADKRSDVAVVKIEASGLPAVKVGDVSSLRVGQWVVAIGSPFGFENTVTAGIVSAKQRDTGDYLSFIQTDVAINPGNSGGPLINMRGEVVGINSQIYSRSGGSMGISFSIPIDEAIRVSEQLRSTGRVTRGRIGVQIDQVSKDVAESIGLGRAQGALVRAVEPDAPADKAGVEAGDIILKFDGKTVEKVSDLPRMVGSVKPGTKSTLTVFRRGSSKELSVVVGEVKVDKQVAKAAATPAKPKGSDVAQSLGLMVTEVSDSQKSELKIKGGVVVEASTEAAARAGVREGDVILQVANTLVTDLKSFEAAVGKLDKAKPVLLLVRRGNLAQLVVVRRAN